jgi:hypothetical protein
MQGVQMRIGLRQQMNAWGGMVRATPTSTGPIFSGCVIFQRRRNLTAVDPLTGDTLWVRRDQPAGCELFGDAERLYVVPPNTTEAVVLRAIDGQELGRRQVPRNDERITTLGSLVLVWSQPNAGGKATLKLFDPWEQADIWQHAFDAESFRALADDEAVGVLEKNGRFVLLSLADGKVAMDAQLDPEPGLNEIHLLRAETTDLLITSRPAGRRNMQFQQAPGMMGSSLINGNVHGFDRANGAKVFSRPIENKLLSINQPAELPVLLFAAQPQRQVPGSPQQGNLLGIDKRNGRIVFDDVQAQPGYIEIEGDPLRHEVLLRTPGSSVKLAFTDQPYAEEPAKPKR